MMKMSVQMFGKFNIAYDGKPLAGEKVHKESQFNRLLLALLYAWPNGVDKDELESFVVGKNELEEEHTALRVIVYKAKKKLVKLGLPDINLIYLEKGVYYWCREIPIETDCHRMEALYEAGEKLRQSEKKEDIEKSMLCYMDAAYLYRGEFLEMYGAEPMVAPLMKKYRKLFVNCISNASKMMEKLKDWDNLEMLGRFAVSAQPLCNWETLVMEALVQKRMYEDASTYYADVVDFYLKECGIYPSDRLTEIMDEIGDSTQYTGDDFSEIQEWLCEKEYRINGGYYCSFPVFKGIYQMQMRQMERTGQNAYLMLCSLTDAKGKLLLEDTAEDLAADFKEIIAAAIRKGDMFAGYGRGQYLVLLSNTTLENCEVVKRRIRQNFKELGHPETVKFRISCVEYK